ncbi:hypothetical protein F1C58_04000 [Glaciihabitans sp. INWT7]|uniref:hypothetical protein n=1 Tax=Glaciihabitans sp. INWT7 TaxID=2596912 RepID=UPI001623F708|nr:hypothetical protein [Glaciihabitans sp. INWT7]QNE46155.1 hypothetical protein F1C58_04000 [Glaciihabitans sp. INWT7]
MRTRKRCAAVGQSGDPATAFTTVYDQKSSARSAATPTAKGSPESVSSLDGSIVPVIAGGVGGIALLVIIVLVILLVRSSKARKRALAEKVGADTERVKS